MSLASFSTTNFSGPTGWQDFQYVVVTKDTNKKRDISENVLMAYL